jgi:membrane-bound ClpP family serine protease
MVGNTIANIVATLGAVAIVTALVLPGRQTPQVIGSTFTGLSDLTKASING